MNSECIPENSGGSLTKDSAIRLGGCCRDLLDALPDLGRVYVQGRNLGGGVGKIVSEFCPVIFGEDFASDPDSGIVISLSEWIAVHGGLLPFDLEKVPALDFEFACFTSGMSILEIPGFCEGEKIQKLVNRFADSRIAAEELVEWRENIEGPPEICSCCQKASQMRAERVEAHPLYEICRQASLSGFELRCRLQGAHVDIVSAFVPSRTLCSDGFLIVLPLSGDAAWHFDMRMVHSLRISKTRMDGESMGQLEIFDMFGNRNFQITCDVPGIEAAWQAICEEN